MNRSFENIFEKYNISCKVPKRRHKSSKSLSQSLPLQKKEFNIKDQSSLEQKLIDENSTSNNKKDLNVNVSSFYSTHVRRKYYNIKRYKTLDVIEVKNVYKPYNNSSSESFVCSENVHLCNGDCTFKENSNTLVNLTDNNIGSSATYGNSKGTRCDDDFQSQKGISFSDSIKSNINCSSYCLNTANSSKVLDVKSNKNNTVNSIITSYDIPPCERSFSKPSQGTKQVENDPTELDLLIDIIRQEEKLNKNYLVPKILNENNDFPHSKSVLKGGYQELFEQSVKHERMNNNFLKYDKKIGLRNGQLLTVLKLETAYGVTLATVQSTDANTNILIAIRQEMIPCLKIGNQIEAFFDANTRPYKLEKNGEFVDVYLEPFKLLIV